MVGKGPFFGARNSAFLSTRIPMRMEWSVLSGSVAGIPTPDDPSFFAAHAAVGVRPCWAQQAQRIRTTLGSSTCWTTSVEAEVVPALVVPVTLLRQLHEDVVRQTARTETEPVVAQPLLAEFLLHHHQVVQRLLALA